MYASVFKRVIDVIFALALVVLFSPVILVIMILIKRKMGGEILFSHYRSGKNLKKFKIYKFRTMIEAPELSDEERITPFGLFLRKYSLDELPQFFNILKGDMSFIGPRPLLPEYDEHYSPRQKIRFQAKPGISGLAQVKGRNTLTWKEKFEYDVEYVESISLMNDIAIALRTIVVVLASVGFQNHGESKKFSEE